MTVHNVSRATNQESPSGLSTKESDENYCDVVHVVGSWRIVRCKNRIQWIIQHAKKAGTQRRWYGVSYVTNKNSLMRLWTEKTGLCGHSLAFLPKTIRGDRT